MLLTLLLKFADDDWLASINVVFWGVSPNKI